MSRIGKIARLPKAIREELNRRLEDGEEGKVLVAWLNGLGEVQVVLKSDFDGRPINEPNLTAWRQGGYEDWRRQQEALEAASRLVEETAELDALAQGHGLADRAAMMAALAIGEQLMAARRMEDGAEKRRAVLKLVRGLVRLRKTDREHERAQRDAAQAERSAEIHEHWAESARRRRLAAPPAQRSVSGGPASAEASAGRPSCSGHNSASGSAGCEDRSACRFAGDATPSAYAEVTADRDGEVGERSLDSLSDAELMQRLEEAKARDIARRTERQRPMLNDRCPEPKSD